MSFDIDFRFEYQIPYHMHSVRYTVPYPISTNFGVKSVWYGRYQDKNIQSYKLYRWAFEPEKKNPKTFMAWTDLVSGFGVKIPNRIGYQCTCKKYLHKKILGRISWSELEAQKENMRHDWHFVAQVSTNIDQYTLLTCFSITYVWNFVLWMVSGVNRSEPNRSR